MSQIDLNMMMEYGDQLLAVLAGDNTEMVTYQSLHDHSQKIAALRLAQQQRLKDDIQILTSELCEVDEPENSGHANTLHDLETSLKNKVDSVQSQSAAVMKECQKLKEQLSESQREQRTLREQRQSHKDAQSAALPKARCDANLYSNITKISWQYNCEPHEVKGFIKEKHDVKTFNLNSQEVSRFFIANYLWDLMEEDW